MEYSALKDELERNIMPENAYSFEQAVDIFGNRFDDLFKQFDPYGQLYYVDGSLPHQSQYDMKVTHDDDVVSVVLMNPKATIVVQFGGDQLVTVDTYIKTKENDDLIKFNSRVVGEKVDNYLNDQLIKMMINVFAEIDKYHVVDDILY